MPNKIWANGTPYELIKNSDMYLCKKFASSWQLGQSMVIVYKRICAQAIIYIAVQCVEIGTNTLCVSYNVAERYCTKNNVERE